MTWAHIIDSTDRRWFKRCRRAWDLSSRLRQDYEPIMPARVFDFDRAIRDALAVYYFPGMWEWSREIVLPLAVEGFLKSMERQRDRYVKHLTLSAEEERDWNDHLELGQMILKRYFEWAAATDRFSPIRVDGLFEVSIPDPFQPGQDLAKREGVPIHYRGRIQLLVVDDRDACWLVKHRVVDEQWNDLDHMLLDEQGVSDGWAWEHFFPGMKIAGTIYNELRKYPFRDGLESRSAARPIAQHRGMAGQAGREPDRLIQQEGNLFFRRTQIPRSRKEFKNAGRQLALEALDMANPEIRLYPNPSHENCGACAYLRPCIAMNEGANAGVILEASYRKRGGKEIGEMRIGGSTWPVDRGATPPDRGRKS